MSSGRQRLHRSTQQHQWCRQERFLLLACPGGVSSQRLQLRIGVQVGNQTEIKEEVHFVRLFTTPCPHTLATAVERQPRDGRHRGEGGRPGSR